MGNTPLNEDARHGAVSRFYSSATWIEGAATQQMDEVARLAGMISVAGFPDLHPGKYGPVGMTALADRLYPQMIGSDIGCGMSFFELDLPLRKFRIDKAADALRKLETMEIDDPAARLDEASLATDLAPDALGTIGGGNHFCEVQAVDDIFAGESHGLDRRAVYLLVHSGSRSVGAGVFADTLARNGPMSEGLTIGTDKADDWLDLHDDCVAWASLNRQLIAERAAAALRCDVRLVSDIPHNLVVQTPEGFAHYKGAAAVSAGTLAPIAGSRATLSYLVEALPGIEKSHWGISHGAGRKYDRSAMHGRAGANRSERDALLANPWGGVAICDDRNLVLEEAAGAYKDAGKVVADLESFGLVRPVAAMKPLVTYKSVLADVKQRERGKNRDRATIRRPRHD